MKTALRIFSLIFFCVMYNLDAYEFRWDYTTFDDIGHFKYHEIPSNFYEARLRCHLEGAKLMSPLKYDILKSVEQLLSEKNTSCGILTGIHSIFSRGDFFSIEGVSLYNIPHVWEDGQPNISNENANCIILLPNGNMALEDCNEKYPYICYRKHDANLQVTTCGTTDREYEMNIKTGSCYKFHKEQRTWSRAYMTCAAEGGHLAIINSEEEAQHLVNLFTKYPFKSFVDPAFIGFHDFNEHGEWLTVHGETLEEAGYDKFYNGQPDNATSGEFCGSMFRNGYLNDLWCETKQAFICEREPQ